MDDTTRQLLHDAAPPVATGTDFDRLWQQAARHRRLQRVGQAAAAVVLVAFAGLVLPFGLGGSMSLLGGDGNERDDADELVSAPLSDWEIQERPFSSGGPVTTSYNERYALGVFAAEGNRWCIAAAPAADGNPFEGLDPVEPAMADRLLCHEVRPPRGADPVGSVLAIEVDEHLVHVAAVPMPRDSSGTVRVDRGQGMEAIGQQFGGGGGGAPFGVWSTPSVGAGAVAFEFHSPTGETAPMTVEAPEPLPAEVEDSFAVSLGRRNHRG